MANNPYEKRYYILQLKEDGKLEKIEGQVESGYQTEEFALEDFKKIVPDKEQSPYSYTILPLWENW